MSDRLKAAMDAQPLHLAGERWSTEHVAAQFAFRLEQIGSSLESCQRNLERLCIALKVGVVQSERVVAITALDVQRIAAAWGIVVDRAQVKELFALRKLSADAPVPTSAFVRTFSEPVSMEGSILDASRPRSLTRAPPLETGHVDGFLGGGWSNAIDEQRSQSYSRIGQHRRSEFQVRACALRVCTAGKWAAVPGADSSAEP
jgi:hypothetical protein